MVVERSVASGVTFLSTTTSVDPLSAVVDSADDMLPRFRSWAGEKSLLGWPMLAVTTPAGAVSSFGGAAMVLTVPLLEYRGKPLLRFVETGSGGVMMPFHS